MAYPVASDLQAFLQGAGMLSNPLTAAQSLVDLTQPCQTASALWETRTAWFPFLSTGVDETRVCDAPGPELPDSGYLLVLEGGGREILLQAGLLSLTTLSIATVPYILGTQFWLYPQNASNRGKPWTKIRFIQPIYDRPQDIQIVGKWGRQLTLSADVFRSVLKLAALEVLPQLAIINTMPPNSTAPVVEVEQERLKRRYVSNTKAYGIYDGQAIRWEGDVRERVRFYKRPVVV